MDKFRKRTIKFDCPIEDNEKDVNTKRPKRYLSEDDLIEEPEQPVRNNINHRNPIHYYKDMHPLQRAFLQIGENEIQKYKATETDAKLVNITSVNKMAERAKSERQMAENARRNKIKSKGYRKYRKHMADKQELKEAALTKETKADLLIANQEKLEKERIEERMTQKTRSGGKYAKLRNMAKTNPHAKERFDEVNQRANTLLSKTNDKSDSEEEVSEVDSDSEVDDVAVNVDTDLLEEINECGETVENFLRKTDSKHLSSSDNNNSKSNYNYPAEEIDEEDDEESDSIMEVMENEVEEMTGIEKKEDVKSDDISIKHNVWYRDLIKETKNANQEKSKKKKTLVFIDTSIPDCTKKHLVTKVPYPYNTKEQFELAMKKPVMAKFSSHSAVHRNKKGRNRNGNKVIKPKRFKNDMF